MSLLSRLRSLPALGIAASLLTAPLLVGCGYGDGSDRHDHDYIVDVDVSCGDVIEESTIDTDELLDVDAGAGAGTFVEYEAGGTYHITTSCDADNGGDCYWDILVRPLEGALVSAAPADLEADDSLSFGADDSLRLVAYTGRDFDGFTIQTEPGAALEVDALLDNACGNRYLFWVGDGALHSGAPSNPIDLVPSEP
jgi:hypothetical protein